MPSALHPQAKFDPIPPDLDFSTLVEKTANFDYAVRIGADHIHELGYEQFEKLVLLHVIVGGKPLVIEGWNKYLPPWLFSQTWLEDNVGQKAEKVRDIVNGIDIPMTIGHYLGAMEKLTKQWTPANYRDPKRQRLYLKDIDCPEPWHQHLQNVIPRTLFYLNDCVGEEGGPGTLTERNTYNQLVLGKGVGPAGDLMSNLPPEMRAENMMCYIGHEGTYTPAHREMCASLGQNIMVETSATEKGEKAGSSIWFMTESKDREVVSEYFLSMLGHDIEVESHFAQINAWKKAPFPVYIVNQRAGDFILIPPLAPHQVWNRGTRTMKVAWNRTTVETLELALHEALPRARMVCRDEQYKNKAIIYFSLLRYSVQLKCVQQAEDTSWDGQVKDSVRNAIRVRQLKKDFKRLFALFTEIVVSEMFSKDLPKEKHVEYLPFDSNVTCSYCRCSIFNRFLTCKTCIEEVGGTGDEDTYDICMECYAMGRSCGCVSNLTWVEQWQWPVLTQQYDEWRAMVIANDGFVDDASPPQSLDIARSLYGRKPVAQVCQEQLKRRPWRDISKASERELSPESEPEPEVDDEGRVKKKKGSKRKSRKTQNKACHICQHREWNWKLAFCTTCPNSYCYGTLWRAFDLKPQTVMENPNWQCPKCLKICSCGKCRRDPTQQAYRPKGTLLGHDTRRVADPRSVESMVDFSRTNLTWLRDEGDNDPQTSLRMQRLMEKAQTEKARDESFDEDELLEADAEKRDDQNAPNLNSADDMVIDPQLRDHESNVPNSTDNPDDSHFGNDSTMTLKHMPHSHGQETTASDAEHQAVANGGQAHQEEHQEQVRASVSSATVATMFAPASPYPDPSASGRDRMMGMGYYQQANDADKILFDHPDASIPTEPESAFTYPRLPDDPPNAISGSNKRKVDGEMDDTHSQIFQAQKKQKLADARGDGRYYITLKQLKGGKGHLIKLPMRGSEDPFHNLRELDEGRTTLRHNPRSPCRSVVRQSRELDDSTVIIGTDIQGKAGHSNYNDNSDNQGDSTVPANRAVQTFVVRPTVPKSVTNDNSYESGKKHRRPSKVISENDRKSVHNEDSPYKPNARPSPTQKPTKDRPFPAAAQKKLKDGQNSSPPPPDNTKQNSRSKALEIPATSEVLLVRSPKLATTSEQAIVAQDKSGKAPNSVTKNNAAETDIIVVADDRNRVITAAAHSQKSIWPNTKRTLSEEYLRAKEEVFRMFEAEQEEREQSQKVEPVKAHVSLPTKATVALKKNRVPTNVTKAVPKGPPGQLMSMAERQALIGRPFKIVAAKSTSSRSPVSTPTLTPSSKLKSTKVPPFSCFNFSSDDSVGDGPSSDDSDGSIPAVRPLGKKPRIEALSSHNGNTKANFRPSSRMLDDVRKGQQSVRLVK